MFSRRSGRKVLVFEDDYLQAQAVAGILTKHGTEICRPYRSPAKTSEPLDHHLAQDKAGKHYLIRLIPYRRTGNTTDGVVVTMVDVTRLAEAEKHQQVLISELNHRVKNMLAVTTTIANRTLVTSPAPKDFSKAFNGRLNAMARAYGALSQHNWTDASLQNLLRQELTPFGEQSYNIGGSDFRLEPQHALSMGMVLHELATNAAKHGALSQSGGHIDVFCDLQGTTLVVTWRETGGPPAKPPEKPGFGLELLDGEISYRLRGSLETNFALEGLTVTIKFPVER